MLAWIIWPALVICLQPTLHAPSSPVDLSCSQVLDCVRTPPANVARIREPRTDYILGFQVKIFQTFQLVPIRSEADQRKESTPRLQQVQALFFFFFTLVTDPRRALGLKFSDTRVYEPEMRTRLGKN